MTVNISAKMVQELRETTGAGMMKCKEALIECKGNVQDAVDYLRKKGLASAENKASRATSQGLVSVQTSDDKRTAVILEVNCETDFVARNELFQGFMKDLGAWLLSHPLPKNPADIETVTLGNGQKVEDYRKSLIAKIGENIHVGRFDRIDIAAGKHGTFDAYIHGDGNIGVVVLIDIGEAKAAADDKAKALAHEVALQVAAMKPRFISRTDVPTDAVSREKEVILGQIKNDPKNANKPENVLTKIVEGRLDKFFKEFCLLEQISIRDDSKTVQNLVEETAKALGTTVSVTAFRRWALGENAPKPAEAAAAG